MEEHIGSYVLLMCGIYQYWGKVEEVNLEEIVLSDAHIVYRTGAFTRGTDWEDAQKCPIQPWVVMRVTIESYGPSGSEVWEPKE